MTGFLTAVAKALGSLVWQVITWPQAWYALGPILAAVIAVVVYNLHKRRTSSRRRNRRNGRGGQPVENSGWMRKIVFASLITCLGIGVYAWTNKSNKISVQYVQTTSDQNGEERVAVESIEDIMKTDFAESNQFEVSSTGGDYSIQVKLGGATPRILIYLTGTDKVVGGGALDVPYQKGENVANIGHVLSQLAMDSMRHHKGIQGAAVKLPTPQASLNPKTQQSPQRKATKK